MGLLTVELDDKYRLERGRVMLNGTQALVRLALEQRRRDLRGGLNTAGFVTGYRGSPLGSLDFEFGRVKRLVEAHHVRFHAAVNEDLAATSVWGSQQTGLFEGAKYDGVFAMWYGKGPGVDRSGDALRHANLAGTDPNGGVLALAGDDPACVSSTVPSASEYALIDAQLPILHPADVREMIEFGLAGWAMSRFAGVWVGLKCISDNMDSAASIPVDPERPRFVLPTDVEMPEDGLHVRWPDPAVAQERRLVEHKIPAAIAFARANRLDRVVFESRSPRLGIAATGKTFADVRQALVELGIDDEVAEAIGLRLYKIAMPWPLEPEGARAFAEGLQEVVVVEEKRPVIEPQLKDLLYHLPADRRPRVIGKRNERDEIVLSSSVELTPGAIARMLAPRLLALRPSDEIERRLKRIEAHEAALARPASALKRLPYFCAGCPHNTSTKVPEGSRALAGIGCHFMTLWMDRSTETFTQMGAEGSSWIGQAPFTETEHVFVNIGDGTWFHSGILALRAAVAAGVNITYKILYNDAVAMTGGQGMDGPLDPAMITRQAAAEGVERIAVVSEDPARYGSGANFAPGTSVHHRDEMDTVQRDIRHSKGVSVIVYDQTCAAEKRRRRKRGKYPDPPRRVFINEDVCEGCGDCGVQSNCVAIQPVETELGRKRQIDQSVCNKDFSCLKGFCPSFVTVEGGELRKDRGGVGNVPFEALPEPGIAASADPYGIVLTGIGGTGVVTIGAIVAMAAHMEGKGVAQLDIAGLSQKNGMVFTHLKVCDDPARIHAVRIAAGEAKLLLGCDLITAAEPATLARLDPDGGRAVINTAEIMATQFTRQPDLEFPGDAMVEAIAGRTGAGRASTVDARRLSETLIGDSIGANMFLLGFAWQQGLVPVGREAIEAAIELNGVAVPFNLDAFLWGRRAAHDLAAVEKLAGADDAPPAFDLDGFVARRKADLTGYQNAALAGRYAALVDEVRAAEAKLGGGEALTEAVARGYFKLLAYKDEYEVARLYAENDFLKRVHERFQGDFRLHVHLAPPLLSRPDPATGRIEKREYGPWMLRAFAALAKLRFLRGSPLDPFGYTAERRMERRLIGEYETVIRELLAHLSADNREVAVELARLPLAMRGFGHVKERNVETAKRREAELLATLRSPTPERAAAE